MKKTFKSIVSFCTLVVMLFMISSVSVFALEPIAVPEVPIVNGASLFNHNFEGGEFDTLLPIGGVTKTDSNGNSYSYKSGSAAYATVVDGNGGKALKLDGSSGSDTYVIITPSVPLTQKVVLSFDVMTDTIATSARREVLKMGETTSPTNRPIDFMPDGTIMSNGVLFADYPNYKTGKWYHFDLIIGFGSTTEERNIIVQLTVDGQTYQQDYTHSSTFNQLAALRFASKASFGSTYIDNIELYKVYDEFAVTNHSIASDAEFTTPVKLTNVTAGTDVYFKSDFTKYYAGSGFPMVLVAAYESDARRLVGLRFFEIGTLTAVDGVYTLQTDTPLFHAEAGKSYELKVMTWDNLGSLIPRMNAKSFIE